METLRARRPDAAIGSFNGLSSHMGRILAIDYGRKRTGLAVTDPLQIIANALDTVPTHTLMDYVKSYAAANAVDAIVIGMPLQMDGLPSESYTYIRPFVEKLRKEMPAMRIELFDERFTSRLALRAMIDGGVPKKRRREAARETGQRGIGTRSQQALQLAREQNRLEKRESSRARRQAEQARRFALRTEKRREKHRGH